MSAEEQFTRIVSLVAALTRRAERDESSATLGDLAREYAATEREITADIRALTLLGDSAGSDWILSLSAWQQGDEVSISSAGPFRRPVQLSPEERLAIQVALALYTSGAALARRFASLWAGDGAGEPSSTEAPDDYRNVVSHAVREAREVIITYTGDGEHSATTWRIAPHQVAEWYGRTYMAAWAFDVNAWRHFRLDRIHSLTLSETHFERHTDFVPLEKPEDLFRPGDGMDRVTVRFSSQVAAQVAERYPEHEVVAGGHVQVQFTTASPSWLARKVLEYGTHAEVLDPERYRQAVLRAIA